MNQMNIGIIKKFKEVFNYDKDFQQSDIENYFNKEMLENSKNIKWLYWSEEQTYVLIGVDEDGGVFALQDEGELTEVCEGLENIPFEMLRIHSFYTKDELVKSVFDYNKDFKSDLLNYEEWCKNNGVILDTQKVYHDENGNLFTQYFDKN